jgi:hypothetical protein
LVVVANGIASDAVLFRNAPVLSIARSGTNAVLSWSTNYPGYAPECRPTLNPAVWAPVPGTPAIAGNQYVLSVGITNSSQFFRLAPIISWTTLTFSTNNGAIIITGYTGSTVTVYWQDVSGWSLQQNNNLTLPANWSASGGVTTSNGTNYLNFTSPTGNLFFRLKQ